MKCPNCGTKNRKGVKFCEECGELLPVGTSKASSKRNGSISSGNQASDHSGQAKGIHCPNCGTKNKAAARFCINCGQNLTSGFLPPADQQKKRRPFWAAFASVGALFLMCGICGFLYWSMLIPVPLLPKDTAGSDLLRRVRIFQENIGRQKSKEANPVRLPEDGELQKVGMKNGKILLPDTCGPQLDLEVGDVSQIQIWDELGQFGSGPLIYSMPNRGESMAEAEFGYHVEWVVIDEGQRKVIKDNQWYACTGWDQDQLTCTGPDWLKYDSAQMCIYYEGPACQTPVECFIFDGEDAFPAQNQQACEQEDVIFRFESIENNIEGGPDLGLWYIWTDDAQAYDNKYILKTTADDGIKLEYLKYFEPYLEGIAPNPESHPNLVWEIIRVPEDVCTDVLASGTEGKVAVEQDSTGLPQSDCEQNVTFTHTGTEVGSGGQFLWVFDYKGQLEEGVRTDKIVWTSIQGEKFKGDCYVYDWGQMNCLGPLPADQVVKWEILSEPNEKCTEPMAEGTQENQEVDTEKSSRCEIFDGLSMSTIFLEWQPGTPLTFYLKIPGGVPGLERNIVGDDQLWYYDAEIGGYKTDDCRYEGYEERLYCRISLPSEYSSSIQPLDININGCDVPIYTDQRTELPNMGGQRSSGGSSGGSSSGSSGSGPVSCAGGSSCPSGYYCDTMYDLCVPQ